MKGMEDRFQLFTDENGQPVLRIENWDRTVIRVRFGDTVECLMEGMYRIRELRID